MSKIYSRIIKVILVAYVVINWAVWSISPVIIDRYVSDFLAPHNLQLGDQTYIRYNPFVSVVTIDKLAVFEASSNQLKNNTAGQDEPNTGVLESNPQQDVNSQADVNKQSNTLVALDSGVIEFSLFKLLANKLVIEDFILNGLAVDVDLLAHHVNLITQQNTKAVQSESAKKQKSETPSVVSFNNIRFELPQFLVNNAQINLSIEGQKQSIAISQLALTEVLASTTQQNANLNVELMYNQAKVEFAANLKLKDFVGQLDYRFNANKLALNKLKSALIHTTNGQIDDVSGLISLLLNQSIRFTKTNTVLVTEDLNITLNNLKLEQKQQNKTKTTVIELNELIANNDITELVVPLSLNAVVTKVLNGENTQASLLSQDILNQLKLRANVAITQKQFLVSQRDASGVTTGQLIKLNHSDIPQVEVLIEHGESLIQIPSIVLNQLVLANTQVTNAESEVGQTKMPPLIHANQIDFNNLEIINKRLLLEEISIGKVRGAINKLKNGEIAQLAQFMSTQPDNDVPVDTIKVAAQANEHETKPEASQLNKNEQTPQSLAPFSFYIGAINLSQPLVLSVNDRSVIPSYTNNIEVTELIITPIDSSAPAKRSLITISGLFDQYSKFTLDANMTPFSQQRFIEANIRVTEFDLSTITAYLQQVMAIESGQLNTDSHFVIQGDKIEGKAKLNLARVELTEAVDYESASTVDTFIPINMALSMLKDSKGNIEMNVPIEGDLDSPDFQLSGFVALLVERATMSASKKYLMNLFVPYANIIDIGMQAGEFMLKVRFQDLMLTPSEADIPASADVFIKQFASLMLDKQETQITICAMSTKDDVGLTNTEKLTTEHVDELNNLSLQRMKNFKDIMVDEYQISSSRLLLCVPRVDNSPGANPRLTFSS